MYTKCEYDPKIPKSHTTDQPRTPRGRVKERWQRHDIQNTTSVKQSTLLFSEMIAKLENDTNRYMHQVAEAALYMLVRKAYDHYVDKTTNNNS